MNMKDKQQIEDASLHYWEKNNNEIKNGVNPTAYILGFKGGVKWIQEQDKWISASKKPKELGFYLCFLIEVNDLGISRYQDLVFFNGEKFNNSSVVCYKYLPNNPTKEEIERFK